MYNYMVFTRFRQLPSSLVVPKKSLAVQEAIQKKYIVIVLCLPPCDGHLLLQEIVTYRFKNNIGAFFSQNLRQNV